MLGVKDKGILQQIIKRCERIESKIVSTSQDEFNRNDDIKEVIIVSTSQDEFNRNDDIKEVICFNIFQIGELASSLSLEFTYEYNKIPWKQIKGMRNRIVHGYDTIDLEIVWNTAIQSIPELKEYCSLVLK